MSVEYVQLRERGIIRGCMRMATQRSSAVPRGSIGSCKNCICIDCSMRDAIGAPESVLALWRCGGCAGAESLCCDKCQCHPPPARPQNPINSRQFMCLGFLFV
ncbi:hypothetical protein ACJJTC_011838 [Scirpophaga incertulas]